MDIAFPRASVDPDAAVKAVKKLLTETGETLGKKFVVIIGFVTNANKVHRNMYSSGMYRDI